MAEYLFIDGAYLRSNFENQMGQFYGEVPSIDFAKVASTFPAARTYYYDAIDYSQRLQEDSAQYTTRIQDRESFHDYINTLPGFHIRDGRVRKSPSQRRREQKGVDVQLAVDALEHAAAGNISLAQILTGDLDFEPLLASLVRLGVRTKLIYVASTTAPELIRAADGVQKLTLETFFGWSAYSFQSTHKQVRIQYNEHPPDEVIFKPIKEAVWGKRRVVLYQPVNQSSPRIHAFPEDEIRDRSYTLVHEYIEKLPQAFEMTFGEVVWTDRVVDNG